MFRETPQSRQLLAYLASAKAQTEWAGNTPPGRTRPFFANSEVPLEVQPKRVARPIAEELRDSRSLCLDGSDAMPTRMRLAFQRAALAYLSEVGKGPDALLTSLEKVRTDLHRERGRPWLSSVCG
jgi:alpha-glucoside transport system substrate-binding protein